MDDNGERSGLIYVLAGVGLGALIGAAVGLLFAPKAGSEMREDLGHKLDDLKGRVSELAGEVTQKLSQTVDKAKSAMHRDADALEVKRDEITG